MAGRPAPRPKSKSPKSRPTGKHTKPGGRAFRRVAESQKWNKGPAA